jgi:hypothetical protein
MATITIRSPPSGRVQIWRRWMRWSCFPLDVYKHGGDGGGEAASSHAREDLSDALHSAHHRPTFCEHRESGRASLHNRRPQSYTCMGVRAIRFSGSILATARFVRSTKFLIVGAVQGIVLLTSVCIDCVWLHRTYIRDVSCEWSHQCLEHRSLRRVHYVLSNCACFTVVYCLCEYSYTHAHACHHIHHTNFLD